MGKNLLQFKEGRIESKRIYLDFPFIVGVSEQWVIIVPELFNFIIDYELKIKFAEKRFAFDL